MTALPLVTDDTDGYARRRAMLVGVITFVFTFTLVAVAWLHAYNGVMTFAFVGTRFSEDDPNGTTGYDGQFAYFIARDGANAERYMDGATLRFMRIVYPLAARVLALGNPDLVPYTLVLLNVVAHSVGAALLTYILVLWRAPAVLGGLIFALWIGGLYGVRLDLHEPLCFALSLSAVIAYLHQRLRWTIILLLFAMLTKEMAIVFAAGIALHAFFSGKRGWAVLLIGAPVLAFLVWWAIMRIWLGGYPTQYLTMWGGLEIMPLGGMSAAEGPIAFFFLALWLGTPSVVLFVLGLLTLRQRSLSLGTALVLAGAAYVMMMPAVSWGDPVAAYRVGMPIVVTGILFVGQHYATRLGWLAALWMPSLLVLLMIPGLWLGF